MIRKWAAIIAFGVCVYFGYQYTGDFFESHSADFEGYWGESAEQVIRVLVPVGIGVIGAAVVYFLLNFYAREN
jgi:hypothetical protein